MFREMRRSKQILSQETAEKILREGEFGVLALSGDDGYGYALPINYAVEGNKIYFHCAKQVTSSTQLNATIKFLSASSTATRLLPKSSRLIFQARLPSGG